MHFQVKLSGFKFIFLVALTTLKQLHLNLDAHAAEFTKPLVNSLLSSDSSVRTSTSHCILAVVQSCTDAKVVTNIFDLVMQKLTGSDGKRASLEVRHSLIETLGKISLHKSDEAAVFPHVSKSLLDFVAAEGLSFLTRILPFSARGHCCIRAYPTAPVDQTDQSVDLRKIADVATGTYSISEFYLLICF